MPRGLSLPVMHNRQPQAGFTLVEILGVLVIIGLMSSAVALTMPSEKPAIIAQSDVLVMQLNSIAQSSVLSGDVAAFGVSTQAYALYTYSDGEWRSDQETPWLEGVNPTLDVEGIDFELSEEFAPIIVFEPSGLLTPFVLTLRSPQGRKVIYSDGGGRVMLEAE